jgi:hypothetical protein
MAAIITVPAVLLCNFVRLMIWGLLSIYAAVGPVSPWPRIVGAIAALTLMDILVVATLATARRIFVAEPAPGPELED